MTNTKSSASFDVTDFRVSQGESNAFLLLLGTDVFDMFVSKVKAYFRTSRGNVYISMMYLISSSED